MNTNKRLPNQLPTGPAIATAAAVMVLLQSCVPAWSLPVPTPMASRAIVQNSLPLRELWRKGNLVIYAGLVASTQNVFFVEDRLGLNQGRLQVLDATTGQLQWQVADLPNEHSLATDQVRLFIAVDWNIRAYNLPDGKLLWRTPGELPGHTEYRIYPVGQEILVYSYLLTVFVTTRFRCVKLNHDKCQCALKKRIDDNSQTRSLGVSCGSS